MYVRKFVADSLDEALKEIKKELGPDAIILKTVTNKGLKGAFKKKKIEITAAISEKNYVKKAQVDHVMTPQQKDRFYSAESSYISNMIDEHALHTEQKATPSTGGYGKLGLNKVVRATKETASAEKNGLDDFLNFESKPKKEIKIEEDDLDFSEYQNFKIEKGVNTQKMPNLDEHLKADTVALQSGLEIEQQRRIDMLEKKLFELGRVVESLSRKEPTGVLQLRTTLASLDINNLYINSLIKKVLFELPENEQMSDDAVFEFALKEMLGAISTELPLFSSTDIDQPVITVLLSETSCGQSTMIRKLGALKDGAVLVQNGMDDRSGHTSFSEKMFGFNIIKTGNQAEIISECRKACSERKSVFIDFQANIELDETKKFIDGLRRSFDKVEVLISLSAIHSELYNKKVVSRYGSLANGLVVSYLDLCLNFGALFNLVEEMPELPLKFFGTSDIVPDGIENATAERILAGIFEF